MAGEGFSPVLSSCSSVIRIGRAVKCFLSAIDYDGSKAQGATIKRYFVPSGIELWGWAAKIDGRSTKTSVEFYDADGFNCLVCWSCDE
jgi:hypothetical protein